MPEVVRGGAAAAASSAEARYNLARSLAAVAHYGAAIEACREALIMRPNLRPAIQLLDSLQRIFSPWSRKFGV